VPSTCTEAGSAFSHRGVDAVAWHHHHGVVAGRHPGQMVADRHGLSATR
jgi:hypothetical protein